MKTINLHETNSIDRVDVAKIKEIRTIEKFVEFSRAYKIEENFFNDFFYGYVLKEISAEFDLLKINSKSVLNIELKCQMPKGGIDQIHKQLLRLNSYLQTLNKNVFQYTYVADSNEFYRLDRDKKIVRVRTHDFFAKVVPEFTYCDCLKSDIDILFNPDYYLASPLDNTKMFLKQKYYLTSHQESLKIDIFNNLTDQKMINIVGNPNSGRTLLLFDIAMELSRKKNIYFFVSNKDIPSKKSLFRLFPFKLFFKDTLFSAISNNTKKVDYIFIDNIELFSNDEIETLYYFCLKNKSKVIVTMGSSVKNDNSSKIIKDILNNISTNVYLKS